MESNKMIEDFISDLIKENPLIKKESLFGREWNKKAIERTARAKLIVYLSFTHRKTAKEIAEYLDVGLNVIYLSLRKFKNKKKELIKEVPKKEDSVKLQEQVDEFLKDSKAIGRFKIIDELLKEECRIRREINAINYLIDLHTKMGIKF